MRGSENVRGSSEIFLAELYRQPHKFLVVGKQDWNESVYALLTTSAGAKQSIMSATECASEKGEDVN